MSTVKFNFNTLRDALESGLQATANEYLGDLAGELQADGTLRMSAQILARASQTGNTALRDECLLQLQSAVEERGERIASEFRQSVNAGLSFAVNILFDAAVGGVSSLQVV